MNLKLMPQIDLIELRNKMIQLYQAVVMIESGKYDIKTGLAMMKNTSKSIIDVLDEEHYDSELKITPSETVHNIVFSDSLIHGDLFRDVESFFEPVKGVRVSPVIELGKKNSLLDPLD